MNDATGDSGPDPRPVEAYIDRWTDNGSKKRANYQLFLTLLRKLLNRLDCSNISPEPSRRSSN